MNQVDLRDLLDRMLASSAPHSEKMTVAGAVISEVLRQHGMEATLVGGGAIEFHAPEVYATSDLDLVVEGQSRAELDAALTEFGFARRGRHWVRGELFVEVPGNWMADPVDVVSVGPLTLRVVRREVVLADRVVGFKQWKTTAFGAQAVALLGLFGGTLDEQWLRRRLRAEDSEDALEELQRLAATGATVTNQVLEEVLDRLHRRPKGQ